MIYQVTVTHQEKETFSFTKGGEKSFLVEVDGLTDQEARKKIQKYLEPYKNALCIGRNVPWGDCFPCNSLHTFIIECKSFIRL